MWSFNWAKTALGPKHFIIAKQLAYTGGRCKVDVESEPCIRGPGQNGGTSG